MRRPPADEPSSVNYHALEGGGWYPPEHAEIQKRPKGSSVATRVIIAVIAIALVRSSVSTAAHTIWRGMTAHPGREGGM